MADRLCAETTVLCQRAGEYKYCPTEYSASYKADLQKQHVGMYIVPEKYTCVTDIHINSYVDWTCTCSYAPQDGVAASFIWQDVDGNRRFSNADKFFIDNREVSEEEQPYFQMAFQESFELILQAETDAKANSAPSSSSAF